MSRNIGAYACAYFFMDHRKTKRLWETITILNCSGHSEYYKLTQSQGQSDLGSWYLHARVRYIPEQPCTGRKMWDLLMKELLLKGKNTQGTD